MTTQNPIKQNTKILSEEAFAFVPVYDRQARIDFDCQNCASLNIIPIPCHKCCRASYCSVKCLNDHIPIHKYECVGYNMNLWYGTGIAQLSIRTFLCGFHSLVDELKRRKTARSSPRKLFETIVYWSEDNQDFQYGRVLELITNFDKMEQVDFFQYSLVCFSYFNL